MAPSLKSLVASALLVLSTHGAAQDQVLPEAAAPTRALAKQVEDSVQVYDVRDLTGHARLAALDEAAHADDSSPDVFHRFFGEARDSRQAAEAATTQLADAIRAWVEPPLDEARQRVDAVEGGLVVVLADSARQDWVRRFLEVQRGFHDAISIRVRLVRTSTASVEAYDLADFVGDVRPAGDAEALLAALRDAGGLDVVAPRVLAFARQATNVSVMREVTCVQGWELRIVEPGATKIADPIVETLHVGTSLDACGVPLPGGALGLDVRLEASSLEEPLETTQIELDPSLPPVTFSLPVQHVATVDTGLVLHPGEIGLLGSGRCLDGTALIAFVEATTIAWDEAARDTSDG